MTLIVVNTPGEGRSSVECIQGRSAASSDYGREIGSAGCGYSAIRYSVAKTALAILIH